MKQQRHPIHDVPNREFAEQKRTTQSVSNQERQSQLKSALHTVAAGETLWKIAENRLGNGNRYMEIAELNGISNPNVIVVGQVLELPSSTSGSNPSSDSSPSSSVSPNPESSQHDRSEMIQKLPPADKEKTLQYLDPLLASMLRQDRKRAKDIFSQSIQTEVPVTKGEEPQRNLLMEAVEQYAKDHPKRDGQSWNGWCASLMFRFGKSSSGFKDGVNDAPSAIKASKRSNIESTDPSKAPKGAFHWWDIGRHGHVGLDVAGGGTKVFMATKKLEAFFGDKANAIGLTSIASYNKAISGGTYLGWSMDYVGGAIQDDLLKEAP